MSGDPPYHHENCADCDLRTPEACQALGCQNREYPAASLSPLITLAETAVLRAWERARHEEPPCAR